MGKTSLTLRVGMQGGLWRSSRTVNLPIGTFGRSPGRRAVSLPVSQRSGRSRDRSGKSVPAVLRTSVGWRRRLFSGRFVVTRDKRSTILHFSAMLTMSSPQSCSARTLFFLDFLSAVVVKSSGAKIVLIRERCIYEIEKSRHSIDRASRSPAPGRREFPLARGPETLAGQPPASPYRETRSLTSDPSENRSAQSDPHWATVRDDRIRAARGQPCTNQSETRV